jgi:hypothetical protein
MVSGEQRLELAGLRIELRAIDAEIARIRQESRRYRQMNFGLDIKDIQLTALNDQRGACADRAAALELELHLQPRSHFHPLSWLLVPIALWLQLNKGAAPAVVRPAAAPSGNAPSFAAERVAVAAGQ